MVRRDYGVVIHQECEPQATLRERLQKGAKLMMWSLEARAAVDAIEEKFDISVCSTEHLETWVDRCERLEASMKAIGESLDRMIPAVHFGTFSDTKPTLIREIEIIRSYIGPTVNATSPAPDL